VHLVEDNATLSAGDVFAGVIEDSGRSTREKTISLAILLGFFVIIL